MPKIYVTDVDGARREIDPPVGGVLMEALRDAGFDAIQAVCGGNCSCATCHVHLDPDWFARLGERGGDEHELVSSVDTFDPARSRLSCQIRVEEALDGLALTIAPI